MADVGPTVRPLDHQDVLPQGVVHGEAEPVLGADVVQAGADTIADRHVAPRA